MGLQNIKYNLYKKFGKDRNLWPVTVWRKVRRGKEWRWEKDRGRRRKNPETGEWEYEFLKDDVVTDAVSYEHIQTGSNGNDLLIVAKPEKDVVMPVNEETTVRQDEDYEGPAEADMKWVMDQSHFIQVGKNALERSYDIVQTDEGKWWQEDKLQAAFLFVGAGIFFMLLGISYSKVISNTAVEQLNQIAQQSLPFIGLWVQNQRKERF